MHSLISLTFDDGLRCHFEQALPILNAHGLPATFFLIANNDSALKDGFKRPRWKKTDWNKKGHPTLHEHDPPGTRIRFAQRTPQTSLSGS